MGRVFVNIGLSLDGYMAPEGMAVEHWEEPEHLDWAAKWGSLMGWIFELEHFRENLGFGEGGETGPVNDLQRRITEETGANIMGQADVRPGRDFLAGGGAVPQSGVRADAASRARRGCGRAGRRFTSSRMVRSGRWSWPGRQRGSGTFGSRAGRT